MKISNITYIILSICLFFIASISLLSLQNNDIKVPQKEVTVNLDLSHKFNLRVANRKDDKEVLSSN